MHLQVGGQRDAASVSFETEQPPAVRHRLCATAGRAHDSSSEFPVPSRARPQFAAQALKFASEPFIQNKARNTQSGFWERARRDPRLPGKERRAPRGTNTRPLQPLQQTKACERVLPAATDEFAADAVSWIATRFPHRDRHTALAQTDAQRQAGQSTAHDGDALTHFLSR